MDIQKVDKLKLRCRCEVRVHDFGECWTWRGHRDKDGYGRVYDAGKQRMAHQVMYEAYHGKPVPEGHTLDHQCRNRDCIKPDHLKAVPRGVNAARRGWNPIDHRIRTWVSYHCLVAEGEWCPSRQLWRSWQSFCERRRQDPGTQDVFFRRLKKCFRVKRRRLGGSTRTYVYDGIDVGSVPPDPLGVPPHPLY